MTKELKIVVGPNSYKTMVYLNDEPIGLIQDIKIHVSCNDPFPQVEIVFPNLFALDIGQNYYQSSPLPKQLAQKLWDLSEVPNLKVTLQDLF